ncbi:nucleoside hydrolase [Tichowtungia aerotolerans]|nr:nucleoside hydrolase [Tichowtungia aerotolerans]
MEKIKKPVQLLLDTDMGNDIDDALALAMIHALQSRGECELIGVTVSKDNPYAAMYVDLINTFYSRGNIPIGCVANGATPEEGTYARQVVELADDAGVPLFERTMGDPAEYPSAVAMTRRLLAASDDEAVVVLMIGFSTNMARLLESSPDEHSELGGLELFKKKVSHVVMMAGEFAPDILADPMQKKAEFNVRLDVPSARAFIARCPRPIWFSGLEVGKSVLYPAAALDADYGWCTYHPVVEAYKRYLPMPYDRPTWDLTAVLFAVRPGQGYFGVSEPGLVNVDENGYVRFRPHPDGLHRYLTVNDQQRVLVGEVQNELAAQPCEAETVLA